MEKAEEIDEEMEDEITLNDNEMISSSESMFVYIL
jgi:hypothetical protein